MGDYKSSRQVIQETVTEEVALALLYIETERQMLQAMRNKDDVVVARNEGIMEGILTTARLLGVKDLYGKTITNLRFAIQEENKEYKEKSKTED